MQADTWNNRLGLLESGGVGGSIDDYPTAAMLSNLTIRDNIDLARGHTAELESQLRLAARTVMTGLSVLISLLSLVFFGPLALRDFSLVLFVGIVIGTYSSMFIGSPALIEIQSRLGKGRLAGKRKRSPAAAQA